MSALYIYTISLYFCSLTHGILGVAVVMVPGNIMENNERNKDTDPNPVHPAVCVCVFWLK